MKKIIMFIIISIFLVACGNENTQGDKIDQKKNDTLNTSNLTEEEQNVEGDAPEDFDPQYISYIAPSVDVALEAIPFSITLPNELPFDAQPFKVMRLWDWSRDGKEIEVEFWTVSDTKEEAENNTGEGKVISIIARNFEVDIHQPKEKEGVNITDNIKGQYADSSLYFEVDGVYYMVQFVMGDFDNTSEELIKIAKQML
jgi:hypothetical protein